MKKKKVIAQQVLSAVLATAIASNSSGFIGASAIVKAAEDTVKNEGINNSDEVEEEIIAVNGEISEEPTAVELEDFPNNDELFEGYLNQLFYGSSTYSLGFGESDLSALNENEKKVYAVLKDFVTEVANGDRESTEFYLCPEDTIINDVKYKKNIDLTDVNFSKNFSWEEGDGNTAFNQASKELQKEINEKIDCRKIIMTLLSDCPYELYWFAKTEGYIAGPMISGSWSSNNGTATAKYFQFSFIVDKYYAQSDSKYLIDSTQIERAKNAKANADKIVANHANEDDYTKLRSYLKEICDLNEYNHNAASSSPNIIGIDPWQLVYVFDGEPDTNVVCEGYSKAFAYLFEKSTFQNDIKCYIVSGNLDGGGHMWNIVTMEDGKNYMVDVTNCDDGTVGSPDKLFLAGLPGTVEDGYIFTSQYGTKCSFTYKDDTLKVYPKDILTLASDNYKPKTAGEISASDYETSYVYGDTVPTPTKDNFTTNNDDTDASWSFQWYEGDQTDGNLSQLKPLDAPKNTGTYTLVAKVTSTNYTPAERRTVVTIEPKSITLNAKDTNRKYGEPNPEFTCELADGQTLVTGDQLTDLGVTLTTDATEDSEPGEYDVVAEGIATNTNYNVTVNKGKLTINKKEAISLEEEQQNYSCTTGSGEEAITIDVKSKLPEDIGTASYSIEVSNDSDIIDNVAISTDGKLTYKVLASDSSSIGKTATITVTVTSTYYENSIYKVTVELTDNIVYSGKDGALSWSIDEDGLLTITGNGDYSSNNTYPEWLSYTSSIKKAKLNVANITNMQSMFSGCSELTELDLSQLNTSQVTNMQSMFSGCSGLTELDLSQLNTSNVTNMQNMLGGCSGLTTLNLSNFDTSKVTDISFLFASCSGLITLDLSKLNTSNVTDMSGMFDCCEGLTSVNLDGLDTSKVTDMSGMFGGCSSLTKLDLSPLNTSNVTRMGNMFSSCSSLTKLDLSPLNTSNVTNMLQMFSGCNGLTTLDLSQLNTGKVTEMSEMFAYCRGLKSLNLSNLDTSSVIRMNYMFENCSGLTELNLSSFNTSKVTNMGSMFSGCSGLTELNLSSFNTSSVDDIRYLFKGCDGLTEIDLSNWNISNATFVENVFNDSIRKITAPANIKIPMDLPEVYDGDFWLNENGEHCTEIAANLSKPMIYTKFVIENIEDVAPTFSFAGDPLVYTGNEQQVDFTLVIKDGEKVLEEGTDYTCTVTGNTGTDAGDYNLTITVTGIGNYTGNFTIKKDWSIKKAPIAPNAPKDAFSVEIKDGKKVTDIPLDDYQYWKWIKADSQKELPTKAGETLEVTAEYIGNDASNYEKITQPVTITMISSEKPIEKEDIADATYDFSLVGDSLVYTGNEQSAKFSLSIQAGEKKLVEGTDYSYEVTGDTGTAVGDYKLKITVTGIGNYTGELLIEKDWSIKKAPIAPNAPKDAFNVEIKDGQKVSDISLDAYPNWKWIDADSQKELPTKAAITLDVTAEYTGDDASNYEKTTQPVTITMIEKSELPVEKESIADATYDVTLAGDSLVYTGNEQKTNFSLSIQSGEKILVAGTDYTYTVTENTGTNAGDYKLTITVTGIGNYTGNFSIKKDWSIAKAPVAPSVPKDAFSIEIKDGQKVNDIPLDAYPNWKWIDTDQQKELPTTVGETLDVTAEYVGKDASNYEKITQTVTITMINSSGSSSSGGSNNNPSGGNNTGNGSTGNGGTSGSIGGSTVITTPPTNTTTPPTTTPTQPEQENTDNSNNNNNTDNSKPNNSNTTTETKADGTTVETTTQTTANGSSVTTVTETKTDGSTAETKTVTTNDSDAILTIKKETTQQGTNTSAVISTGKQGNVTIPAKLLETVAQDESVKGYVVEISSPTVTAGQKLIKNTVVTINLPSTNGINAEDIVLTQDSIQTAKETGKGLKIVVITENNSTNAGNSNYTVTIPSKQLSKIDNSIDNVSIAMSVNTQNDKINNSDTNTGLKTALFNSRSKAEKTCVISTAKNETLDNVGMKLQIDVTTVTDVKAGNKVYVYKYNEKTGKLEEMANSKQTVASDGTVSIEGYSGTDYVVSAKKLTGKSVATIKNGIRLNVKKTSVKQGKKLPISLVLPDTVSTGNKFGTEKATVVYKSNNLKVASVSKKGVITAKKAGKVIITVVIKLESGQKITKTKKITIK